MRLDPGVAERNVSGLGDHVVAPVAGRVLEEACTPVAVGEMPPILLGDPSTVEIEMSPVPVGGPSLVLDAIIERANLRELGAELPGETLDHRRALHVPTEKAKRVRHPLGDQRIGAPQEMDRLDKTGD